MAMSLWMLPCLPPKRPLMLPSRRPRLITFYAHGCLNYSAIFLQDLEYVSEHLEGRSRNPVSVLFDSLMRPNADIGEDHAPTLSWQHDPSRAISHVVIGSGRPGGAWHKMQPDLETVSLGHWLELPGYPFNQWKIDQECNRSSSIDDTVVDNGRKKRALLGEVARYYDDYVTKMRLEDNFLNDVEVVCAADINKRSKTNSTMIVKSQSSSTSSSLSSSPSLDSPTHTAASSTDILRSLRADIPHDREEEEDDSEALLTSDDVFQIVDSEIVLDLNTESCLAKPQEDSVDSALTRVSEVCEINRESELVPCPLQSFVLEPRTTSCFSESSCCCISDPDDCGVFCRDVRKLKPEYRWCIRGKRLSKSQCGDTQSTDIKILAKKVVLACGVDRPRRLGVLGESLSFVHHQLSGLDTSSSSMSDARSSPVSDDVIPSNPILIIGAGLSAADAVLQALEKGVKVVHAFYQDSDNSGLIFHKMPPDVYKEYRHVFTLMQGKATHECYTPLPKHKVVEFEKGGRCRLRKDDNGGREVELDVSSCYVLIGAEADLGFLPQKVASELGVHADSPIHPKTNPVSIDPSSFQTDLLPSLYAVGPLVGDNFVRFVLGGALGVAHHVISSSRSKDV